MEQLADNKAITPRKVILYNALRGKPLTTGFGPTVNPKKVKGLDVWYAYNDTASQLIYYYGSFYDHASTSRPEVKERID